MLYHKVLAKVFKDLITIRPTRILAQTNSRKERDEDIQRVILSVGSVSWDVVHSSTTPRKTRKARLIPHVQSAVEERLESSQDGVSFEQRFDEPHGIMSYLVDFLGMLTRGCRDVACQHQDGRSFLPGPNEDAGLVFDERRIVKVSLEGSLGCEKSHLGGS